MSITQRELNEERHDKADLYLHLAKTSRKPTISKTMTIEIDVDIEISATWHRGYPETPCSPEELEGYVPDGYVAKFRGVDVSDMITDDEVQELLDEHEED